MYSACFVDLSPILNVTGDKVSFWESPVPQVFQSTKVYGCTSIRVNFEPGGVSSGDVSGPSLIRVWGELDQCHLYLFMAIVIILLEGVCYLVKHHIRNECIYGSFLIFNTTHCTSSLVTWQTLSKWFCLPYALHVWLHAGHIRDLSPDPAPTYLWLLQPLHAFWRCLVLVMVFLCL